MIKIEDFMPSKPTTQPKLSILIPTFNRAQLLRDCLQSILSQKWDHENKLEIVILDGGSKDATCEFLQSIVSTRLPIIYQTRPNRRADLSLIEGWPAFMNRLIDMSSAPWFLWLNDDCVMMDNSLNIINNAIKTNNCTIGAYACKTNMSKGDRNQTRFAVSKNFNRTSMNFGLIRRTILNATGKFEPSYEFYNADGDLSMAIWNSGHTIEPLDAYIYNDMCDDYRAINKRKFDVDMNKFRIKWSKIFNQKW
jgi:glycosyltransferase involved in cell wall biosynthesis